MATGTVFGQVTDPNSDPNDPTNTGLFDQEELDSIPEADREIVPRVALFRPFQLWEGKWVGDTSDLPLRLSHIWDERDSLSGWSSSLGQVGLPYVQFYGGLPSYYSAQHLYRNPLTGQPDVYILDPGAQIPHYDTRTPYVVGHFHQAAQRSQFLNVRLTQNITPFWNAAMYFNRRTSDGPYAAQTADHYNIGLSATHETFGGRFLWLVSAAFNQLNNDINGGANVGTNPVSLDTLYDALATPILLSGAGAQLRKRQRSVSSSARYRLVGDSLRNLSLIASASYNDYRQLYSDGLTTVDQNGNTLRAYGALQNPQDTAAGSLEALYTVRTATLRGGLQASVRIGNLQGLLIGDVGLEQSTYYETNFLVQFLDQQRTHVGGYLALRDTNRTRGLRLEARGRYTLSNQFSPEQQLQLHVAYAPNRRNYSLADSQEVLVFNKWKWKPVEITGSYAPWEVRAEAFVHNRNPSVWQAYWTSDFKGESTGLQNELAAQAWLGFTYTGPPRSRRGFAYLQNRYTLRGFASLLVDPILTDSLAQAVQFSGTEVTYLGVEAQVVQRLFSRFYLQGWVVAQTRSQPENVNLARWWRAQPQVYGRLGIFYEDRPFREAYARFRIGLEGRFFSAHRPLSFDAGSQQFYPSSTVRYKQPAFMRVDLTAEAKLSPVAHMFLHWQFVNNLFLADSSPGYLTTSLYPEWPAALTWGVRYRFFD